MSDRTVHAYRTIGAEVELARYSRSGTYFLEYRNGDRMRVPLSVAAEFAASFASTWLEGRPGGMRLDAAVRKLRGTR